MNGYDSEATRRALMRMREGIRRRRSGGDMGEARGAARDYAGAAMDAAFGDEPEREPTGRARGRIASKEAIDRIFGASKGGSYY